MIAHLQPLIKFELYSHQVEDVTLSDEGQERPPQSDEQIQEESPQVKKLNKPRRRTLRPSLGTILEESAESRIVPCLTPNMKSRPAYMSPVKQWSAAVDRLKTPTKIAGSPMSRFSLAATPDAVKSDITNERGHFRVPSPTSTETTAAFSDIGSGTPARQSLPSPSATDSTPLRNEAIDAAATELATESSYHTTIPIFDQPADQALAEPVHEFKRRISLNNALRSDRRSSTRVLKTVKNWIASTHTPNRRHSDVAQIMEQPQGGNRRHTLDVDVGRNPDIFGQKLPEPEVQISRAVDDKILDQETQHKEKSMFDMRFAEFQQKMNKRNQPPINEAELAAEIDEDVVNVYLHLAPKSDVESPKPSPQTPRKYSRGMEIPWDDFKLFAGVKIAQTTEGIIDMNSVKDAVDTDAITSASPVPASAGIILDGEQNTSALSSEEDSEGDEGSETNMDITFDISGPSDKSDGIRINEPTVNVLDCPVAQVEDPDETIEDTTTATTVIAEEIKDNADDDSALALLHSFVRKAQTSKEGKQNTHQDTVPIFASAIARKRLSGSMMTSDTGSPMAKAETESSTPSPRKPLEARDANRSPSPKKRKLGETGDAPLVKKCGRLAKPDLEDIEPSQPRKRRKKMESDTDDIFNPEMDLGQNLTQKSQASGIARRSSRIATTKSSKAISTIPVRFPGSSGMLQDPDMPAVSTTGINSAVLQRKVEKDLATETRTNTRRNKGGAVPVPVALVALAQQPFEETTTVQIPCTASNSNKSQRPSGNKTVRWDAVLARVQGEEYKSSPVTSPEVAQEPLPDNIENKEDNNNNKNEDEEDENMPSPPQMRHIGMSPAPKKSNNNNKRPGTPVAGGQLQTEQITTTTTAPAAAQPEPEKKLQTPRRSTRSATTTTSRLPRTRSNASSPAAAPAAAAAPVVTTATPKKSTLSAPSRKAAGRPAAAAAPSVAGRLGTPAPKRRGARRV